MKPERDLQLNGKKWREQVQLGGIHEQNIHEDVPQTNLNLHFYESNENPYIHLSLLLEKNPVKET